MGYSIVGIRATPVKTDSFCFPGVNMLLGWRVGMCVRQGHRGGETDHIILDGEWHEENKLVMHLKEWPWAALG